MLFAIALLLIHPQLSPTISLSAANSTLDSRAPVSAPSSNSADAENSSPTSTTTVAEAESQPPADASATLPDAPMPTAALNAAAPAAFLKAGKPLAVSVDELRAENRRKILVWKGLTIASSGAATFDAWTTRRAITSTGAVELNPLLKPFSGNASLYAAIQVGPALFDFAGKKMMYNRHTWVRRMWWLPQSASFVTSMFCGAHNLAFH